MEYVHHLLKSGARITTEEGYKRTDFLQRISSKPVCAAMYSPIQINFCAYAKGIDLYLTLLEHL